MTASGRARRAATARDERVNPLVPLALAVFVVACYQAMRKLGPARGSAAALLAGWMFLPVYDGRLAVPFLPSKMTFVATVVLVVGALVDLRPFQRLRMHWVDLVVAVLCLGPFATALANDLGAYEGFSAALYASCAWGAPYLLGRVHLGSPKRVRYFAVATVVAGAVYAPLCLWEIRMSPQLHRQLYGFATFENFGFAVRFGGYRPNVFMQFGLMVGTFMASATLAAYWLWRTRTLRTLRGITLGTWTAGLAATTILVKSTGAIVLLVVGVGALEATRLMRRPVLILALALIPIAFAGARISGWNGEQLADVAGLVNAERQQSIEFRLMQEERLLDKALRQPWLGWGRFGRSRVYDEDGKDISVTDSLWIIALGTGGLVGLASLGLMLLLPTLLLVRRFPVRRWAAPEVAPAVALALATVLFAVDSLLNAMTSPIFPATSGALVSFVAGRWFARRRPAAARAAGPDRLPPPVAAT